jgi:hypothetical protein
MAGLSFAPLSSDRRAQQQNTAALSPATQALQVLSLHLPRILGARAVSPSSLLAPQPGGASPVSPDAAVLQSALQAGRSATSSTPLASSLAPSPGTVPPPAASLSPTRIPTAPRVAPTPVASSGSPADLIRTILQALGSSSQNGGYSGGNPLPRVVTGVQPGGTTSPSTPVAAPPLASSVPAVAASIARALQGGSTSPITPQFRRV